MNKSTLKTLLELTKAIDVVQEKNPVIKSTLDEEIKKALGYGIWDRILDVMNIPNDTTPNSEDQEAMREGDYFCRDYCLDSIFDYISGTTTYEQFIGEIQQIKKGIREKKLAE